jgi:hypothetical protein
LVMPIIVLLLGGNVWDLNLACGTSGRWWFSMTSIVSTITGISGMVQ